MGCWNGTCGLTGLPIHESDPVVAMIIAADGEPDATPSYPWSNFEPVSIIVRGKYDDYGGVELDERETARMLLTQDEARSHMVKIKRSDKPDDFGYGTARHEVSFVPGFRQENEAFSLWMAHAAAFDDLIDTITDTEYENVGGKYIPHRYTIGEQVRAKIEKNLIETAKNDEGKRYGFRMDSMWDRSGSQFSSKAVSFVSRCITAPQDNAYIEDMIKEGGGTPKPFEPPVLSQDEAVAAWGDLYALSLIMSSLRMTLYPTGSCGSQDSDVAPYEARNAVTAKLIAASKARYSEDEDEDEADAASA